MKHNGYFTFPVADSWVTCSDESNKSGTILPFDAVYVTGPAIIGHVGT